MQKGLISKATLTAIADAIRDKTGETAAYTPSQMAEKIAGLSSAVLPELTTPADVAHVLAGKEYIDASGTKQSGTLVVMDTVGEVETIGIAGTGLSVDLESTADGSSQTLTLPEPNLTAENIKSGVRLFGIAGSCDSLKSASGTFTLTQDAYAPTVEHGLGVIPELVIVQTADADDTPYSIGGFVAMKDELADWDGAKGNVFIVSNSGTASVDIISNNGRRDFKNGLTETSFVCPYNSATYKYRAGWVYRWQVISGLPVSREEDGQ